MEPIFRVCNLPSDKENGPTISGLLIPEAAVPLEPRQHIRHVTRAQKQSLGNFFA